MTGEYEPRIFKIDADFTVHLSFQKLQKAFRSGHVEVGRRGPPTAWVTCVFARFPIAPVQHTSAVYERRIETNYFIFGKVEHKLKCQETMQIVQYTYKVFNVVIRLKYLIIKLFDNKCHFKNFFMLILQSDFPKDSDMVESFECQQTQTNRYVTDSATAHRIILCRVVLSVCIF